MFATACRPVGRLLRHHSSLPSVDASVGGAARLERRFASPHLERRSLLVGSVCYSESTASIWKGIMRHFARRGLDVETILFSSYERMNAQLLAGAIHIAWNGPLAHARMIRFAGAAEVLALGMRDSDRDFSSHCIVRSDAGIAGLAHLSGRRVALGTVDSPQAYVAPLAHLAQSGVPLGSLTVLRFDRDIGKHGDTAHGETAVLDALRSGAAEAGFVSDLMWQRARALPGATDGLAVCAAASPPKFDHCQFTALRKHLGARRAAAFQDALLAMDGSGHPEDAQTLALEGVRKEWLPPRGGRCAPLGTPRRDPSLGYEMMLGALSVFGERTVRWPGILHAPQRHPFKHLIVDSALVRDSFGC
jgi:phosphonate transport system substrate-binding protein